MSVLRSGQVRGFFFWAPRHAHKTLNWSRESNMMRSGQIFSSSKIQARPVMCGWPRDPTAAVWCRCLRVLRRRGGCSGFTSTKGDRLTSGCCALELFEGVACASFSIADCSQILWMLPVLHLSYLNWSVARSQKYETYFCKLVHVIKWNPEHFGIQVVGLFEGCIVPCLSFEMGFSYQLHSC